MEQHAMHEVDLNSPHNMNTISQTNITENDVDTMTSSAVDLKKQLTNTNNAKPSTINNISANFKQLFIFVQYPYCLWLIIGNEFCERFSFYGFKTILSLYLLKFLNFSEDDATAGVHAFIFLAYFTPILGGWLSDSILGKYWTITSLSMVYCLGQIVISVTAIPGVTGTPPHWWGALIGLILVAFGTGGIKPCVSSMGADQLSSSKPEVVTSFFAIFYFSINTGSTLSTFFTPLIRNRFGYAIAFAVPACLLCFATLLFVIGYKWYHHVPPTGIRNNVFLQLMKVVVCAVRNRFKIPRKPVRHWLDRAKSDYSKEMVYDVKCVFRVCKVLLPIMVFWSLFDQHSTRWVFQAARMDRTVGSFTFTADQITTLNPLMVILLVVVFDRVIYTTAAKFTKVTPLRKIAVGLLFTCASFIASTILEVFIVKNKTGPIHIVWQLPQYILLVIGEILVSVTGLEFAYSQAPVYYKGVMQSFYLFTVSMGNIIVFIVAKLPVLPRSMALRQAYEFSFFAFLMFLTFLLFIQISRKYKYRKSQVTVMTLPAIEELDDVSIKS
ncbi:hypothetical protein AKO1_011808 [Acrasis kona]|uniref:Uncharacterized protein n=1 Tax=Acrasis kona TaxID=1008807 RepID=A0AAW2Z8N6_9EUKA